LFTIGAAILIARAARRELAEMRVAKELTGEEVSTLR
jgi:hypothetical protein